MNESIIVGSVVGVVVALISGYISHYLRKREIQALWAEEERRRNSDRRREVYAKDLEMVSGAADGVVETMSKIAGMASIGEETGVEWHSALLARVGLMIERAGVMVMSLKDETLYTRYGDLTAGFSEWCKLLDISTGEAKGGKEKELEVKRDKTEAAVSEVWSRIRELKMEEG